MEKIINELYQITGVPKYVIEQFISKRALPYFRFNVLDCVYPDTIIKSKDEAVFTSKNTAEYILSSDIVGIEQIHTNGNTVKFQYNLYNNVLHLLYPSSNIYEIKCYRCETDDVICNMVSFYNYCLSKLKNNI